MSNATLKDGLGTRVQNSHRPDSVEQWMVNSLDRVDLIRRHARAFEKLGEGTMDMPGFLRQLAPDMVFGLLETLSDVKVSQKLKSQIRQDLLDRAGHGKITKAITLNAAVDPQTTKRELINLIMTKAKIAGVAIQRKETEGEDIIDGDATPVVPKGPPQKSDSDADQVRSEDPKPPPDNSNK